MAIYHRNIKLIEEQAKGIVDELAECDLSQEKDQYKVLGQVRALANCVAELAYKLQGLHEATGEEEKD